MQLTLLGLAWYLGTGASVDDPQALVTSPEGRAFMQRSAAEWAAQVQALEDEITLLRRKLTESPRHVRLLEQRLAEASERVNQLTERNAKLIETLREARSQLLALREEVDRLAQPPSGYGVFLSRHDDNTVDVFTAGRRMRVTASPAVEVDELRLGQSVRLNEALTVVEAGGYERTGEVATLRELLAADGEQPNRALVVGHADEERVVWLADSLDVSPLRSRRSSVPMSRKRSVLRNSRRRIC